MKKSKSCIFKITFPKVIIKGFVHIFTENYKTNN